MNVLIITCLIIIHELGHFFTAIIFGIRVDKIYIYPLGGISKFHLPLNYSSLKEFVILIMGPLFQSICYLFLLTYLPSYTTYIKIYHYSILLFNLLPIYPLDGGKLINILLSQILPFKKSLYLTLSISFFSSIIYFLYNKTFSSLIMTLFLIYKIIKELRQVNYTYEKFLLERFLNNYRFKKSKIITNKSNFYKNSSHLIKENADYYWEKDYLNKKYHFFNKNC